MSVPAESQMRQIAGILTRYAYRFNDEAELHRGIMAALQQAGIAHEHEYAAGDDRYDFLCPGGIVIEAKIKGSLSEALRQIDRYLQRESVAGVVLVTTTLWGRRQAPNPTMRGKPVAFVSIGRQSF